MTRTNGKHEKDFPAREGWEVLSVGNRVIAHNRWGGARIVIEEKPVRPDSGLWPSSWRYKRDG